MKFAKAKYEGQMVARLIFWKVFEIILSLALKRSATVTYSTCTAASSN